MIIVFGASGFLGSAVTNNLANNNQIVAIVRPESNTLRIRNHKNISVVRALTSDWPSLVNKFEPRVIICAQWDGVETQFRDENTLQSENILAISAIAQVAKNMKCEKFIAFGSQAETSESLNLIKEELLSNGSTSYGIAKNLLARQLFSIFEDTATKMIWGRVFSVYGPTESRTSLLRVIYSAMLTGEVLHIREPKKNWSFLYIKDFAEAVSTIVEKDLDSGVINIAHPSLIQIQEVLKYAGLDNVVLLNTERDSEPGYFPIVEKLKSLGWSPATPFEIGCKLTLQSMQPEK